MSVKKILYIFDAGDAASRMPVARLARDCGYDVAIALIGNGKLPPEKDVRFYVIAAPESGLTPGGLLRMVRESRKIIVREKPDLLHAITLKYAFISGLAALAFQNVKKIYTLAGLGYLFHGESKKARFLRAITGPLIRHILKAPDTILIFQNPDDRALMIEKNFADEARSFLVRGSGVDLQRFSPPQTQLSWERPLVLMPTRLVHEKGIHVFVEAARLLKAEETEADFQIAGGLTKHNPRAITAEEMKELTRDGAVKWLGKVEDMPRLLQQAELVVYPSYYGEGIPRVLLEACASGRAIITTDHPGCREAVVHGQNGLLVPVRNARAVADAIRTLLQDADARRRMGQESRRMAEKYFDINIIAQQTLAVYESSEN